MASHRPVTVVTDSTSDLPVAMRNQLGVRVVPLTVTFGATSYRDGIDLTPQQFYQLLAKSPVLPTTSQPSMASFEELFREELSSGHDVVCVTVSSELSGTFNAARLAADAVAEDENDRVRVVDSRATTMQLGWTVVAAARAAQSGASLTEVATTAEEARDRVRLYAVLQTLDYVYKGGRIGRAQHMVGSALAIKPIITFADGVVTPLKRVRTWKKAIGRLIELVEPTPTDLLVAHSGNLDDATRISDTLHDAYPTANMTIDYCGSTIGTYAGPGAVAVSALYETKA